MDLDIDSDFDGKLLDQFRSMGTTDHDVLIAEFQAILGNKLNPESCAFFLDMNNWNLQNAVCSYYDFEQPTNSLPSMAVLADVTVGDGESVAPNTTFLKSWRIKNSGVDRWPPGCHLRFCSGDNLATVERKMVDSLGPGHVTDVHVEMRSPSLAGSYFSLWQMCTPTGTYFGDVINVSITVAEGGLLSLTQQIARIGGDFVHTPAASTGDLFTGQTSATPVQQQQLLPYSSNTSSPQNILTASTGTSVPSYPEEDTEMS